jgi:myotubularin-related protein 1/2
MATPSPPAPLLFAVRKADSLLDALGSSKTALMLQVDEAARAIQLVSPDKQERECYAIASVLVRPLARSSMQLRLQADASAAPSTGQLKFVSTEERDRCLRALGRLRTSTDKSPSRETEATLMCDDGLIDVMETDPRVDAVAGEVAFFCVHRAERLVHTTEGDRAFSGTLTTTNYRLVFSPDGEADAAWSFDVPLTAVNTVERDGTNVQLHCKDVRVVRLAMHDAFAMASRDSNSASALLRHDEYWLGFWMANVAPPADVSRVFGFAHYQERSANPASHGNGWYVWSPIAEYQRLGFLRGAASKHSTDPSGITWRLLKNSKFRLTPTYPQLMVAPSIMTEQQLVQSARFRSRARLPIAVWRHPIHKCVLARSSQPHYGLMGNQCDADRILLKAYRNAANKNNSINTSESPPLRIIDARDLLSTSGNRLMGKGVEKPQHYDNAVIEFVGVANLHKMRESFEALKGIGSRAASLHPLLY